MRKSWETLIDSGHPKADVMRRLTGESRFQMTAQQDADRFRTLAADVQRQIARRMALYEELAKH